MTTLLKLQDIFREIFDDETIEISLETNSDDITDWDSLSQIVLIEEIQDVFNVKFTAEEVINMRSVKDIIEFIESKKK